MKEKEVFEKCNLTENCGPYYQLQQKNHLLGETLSTVLALFSDDNFTVTQEQVTQWKRILYQNYEERTM